MEPSYQLLVEVLGGMTVSYGFLKAVRVKIYTPSKAFVTRISAAMDSVERELGNGGSSLKDKVNRIDSLTARVAARQVSLMAALPEAMFWTDATGEFEMVNRAMESLTGFSRAHLMKMEWVSAIHPFDQARIVKEWLGPEDGAVKHQRAWLTNCRFLTPSGKILMLRVEAHPMFELFDKHKLVGWHGILHVEHRA